MFDMKRAKVKVEVSDYTMTLFIEDQKESKVVYLDYSDYLSSIFFIKEDKGDYALIMKCEDENIEKVIHVFEKECGAKKALKLIAVAMMKQKKTFLGRVIKFFKVLLASALILGAIFLFIYYLTMPSVRDMSAAQYKRQGFRQEVLPEGKSVPLEEMLK